MARRVTETVEEVFVDEPGTRRVTETVEEVFVDESGTRRVTEDVIEVFVDVAGTRRLTEVVIEVFVSGELFGAARGSASFHGTAVHLGIGRSQAQGWGSFHASASGTSQTPLPPAAGGSANRIGGTGAVRRHPRRRARRR